MFGCLAECDAFWFWAGGFIIIRLGVNYNLDSRIVNNPCNDPEGQVTSYEANQFKTCLDTYLSTTVKNDLIQIKSSLGFSNTGVRLSSDQNRTVQLVVAADIVWKDVQPNNKNDLRSYVYIEFAKLCESLDIKWTPLLNFSAYPYWVDQWGQGVVFLFVLPLIFMVFKGLH